MPRWTSSVAILVAVLAVGVLVLRSQYHVHLNAQQASSLNRSEERNSSYAAQDSRDWNLLYHLGGYGPYVTKRHGITNNDTSIPPGCQVDQVHMTARHAERYPTVTAGIFMLELYHRIARANVTLNGTLAFANHWSFFTGDPSTDFEQLTSTGPYAGTLTAFRLGTQLRSRYKDLLLAATNAEGRRLRLWASNSQRVIDTAKHFASGLLGLEWHRYAELKVISEAADRGADTLTPGDTCLRYANDDDQYGWSYGSRMVDKFKATYLKAVALRLLQENPEFPLSEDELYVMQEMCAFEIMALGHSEWCAVFTHDDWDGFEYARDLLHYYRSGPGNPYAATMGWLWLNATSNLLQQASEAGQLFLSFVHDGDIIPILTALDIFPQQSPLSVEAIDHNRTWYISDTVPMGAQIIFERLTCSGLQECWSNELYPNHVYCSPPTEEQFVRIVINQRTVGLSDCDTGPGGSCPLQQFVDRIQQRGMALDRFEDLCGLSDEAPRSITFLHQRPEPST